MKQPWELRTWNSEIFTRCHGMLSPLYSTIWCFPFWKYFFSPIKQSRAYPEELLNWWIFLRFDWIVGFCGLYNRPRDDTAIYMHPTEIFQLIISDQNKTVLYTFVWLLHFSFRNKSLGLFFQFYFYFFSIYKHFYIRVRYKSREIKQQTKIQKWWKADVCNDQSRFMFRVGQPPAIN